MSQTESPTKGDRLNAMLGKKFLHDISAADADLILEALKRCGADDLVDKWIGVKIVATEVRKGKQAQTKTAYMTQPNNDDEEQRPASSPSPAPAPTA